MKTPSALLSIVVLVAAAPAAGVLLDCEINVDGAYTCVEIGETRVSPEAREEARESFKAYIEEAQTRCEYREPRRRTGGRAMSSAQRMEDLKRARREYDECVAREAEALRQADKAGSAAD